MLLIDGAIYEPWTPPNEDEFESVFSEHASDIFGPDSKYFDLKHKLASKAGTGSIPDGYVITFGEQPQVHIIELELASHSLQHIVTQVINIVGGVSNPATQQKICNRIEDEISQDEILRLRIEKAIRPKSIHRFLSDCFSDAQPVINIVIDKSSPQLEEALNQINSPHKVIEFQTFKRVGAEAVHAHLFEPVFSIVIPPPPPPPPPPNGDSVETKLSSDSIRARYILIPAPRRALFPKSEVDFELQAEGVGSIQTRLSRPYPSTSLQRIGPWFKAHPGLKPGDKVKITVIEPMKRYRLEIVR
ncbi:MAG: hypothetical protein HY670_08535 [Chloroflexi bacterium]|nr:hypothetical protein [Chloroflexota bacterium]